MTIGDLEKKAGITDRNAFWMQFAHIKGYVRVGKIDCDAAFEAAVAELRRRIDAKAESLAA